MELNVYRQDGTEAGRTVSLDPTVFDIEPNDHVLWLDVRRIQANGRQGTHKTKERNEVRGSRRKLYRQKGTGLARAGDAKSPIRKSGGRAHGPRPRSYTLNLNKKTKRLARRSAFTYKARDGSLRIVDDFALDAPSARAVREMLDAHGAADQKVLFLTETVHKTLYTSSKNLPNVRVREARNASTVDVLDAQVILLQEGAVDVLADVLGTGEADVRAA